MTTKKQCKLLHSKGVASITFSHLRAKSSGGKTPVNLPEKHSSIALEDCKKYWEGKSTAILAGERSNLLILDCDVPKDGEDNLINGINFYKSKLKKLSTPIAKTPSGGYHVFFKYSKSIKTGIKVPICGFKSTLDILGNGKLVYAHPTTFKGTQYQWIKTFKKFDPIEIPEKISEQLAKKSIEIERTFDTMTDIEDKDMDRLVHLCKEQDSGIGDIKYASDTGVFFYRESPSDCELCGREHENDNCRYGFFKDGLVCIGCSHSDGLFTQLEQKRLARIIKPAIDVKKEEYFPEIYKYINKTITHEDEKNIVSIAEDNLAMVHTSCWTLAKKLPREYGDGFEWSFMEKNGIAIPDFWMTYTEEEDEEGGDPKIKEHKLKNYITEACKTLPVYTGVTFDPSLKTNQLNLFTGYIQEPYEDPVDSDDEDIQPFIHHIYAGFANGDGYVGDYFIYWLANMIQGNKNRTAIVLYSYLKQTAGKSKFCEWFGKYIIGQYYYTMLDSIEPLFDRFNEWLTTKMMCVLDEAIWKGDKRRGQQIKSKITEPYCNMEIKGGAKFTNIPDFKNYIFNTNVVNPLPLESGDKRFVFIKCNDAIAPNKSYWVDLLDAFQDPVKSKKFLKYLLDLDLTEFDLADIPETQLRMENLEAINPMNQWIEEYNDAKTGWIPILDLFGDYTAWCSLNGYKKDAKWLTRRDFTRELKDRGIIKAEPKRHGAQHILSVRVFFPS